MDSTILLRLAVALALGLVIGIERGWKSRHSPEGSSTAGIRTFGFVGLFGGISARLAAEFGPGALAVGLLVLGAVVAGSYVLSAWRSNDLGITTELALLVTFGLGALAAQGFEVEALAAAVVTATLLGFKRELHVSLERLERRELTATLQLLLIAAVALPLLPNRGFGPWQALNPRTLGLLVLLIAGISYVGYFAVRILGTRGGILASGVLGGLASSTAATVAFANLARRPRASAALLGAGIALAAGTMAPRLLIEVGVVDASLVPLIALPLAPLALIPVGAALIVARRHARKGVTAPIELRNPLQLESAVGYGLALAVLFVALRATREWLGDPGVYLLAGLSGIADVDAVSISLAEGAGRDIPKALAARGIVTAALVNTAAKALLSAAIGGRALARWCVPILGSALLASLLITLALAV